jgi:hypothetical protein
MAWEAAIIPSVSVLQTVPRVAVGHAAAPGMQVMARGAGCI